MIRIPLAPRWLVPLTLLSLSLAGCCCSHGSCFSSLRGEGFQGWNESLGAGVRSGESAAQPSGFFTDRRSDQIEQNLGGGF